MSSKISEYIEKLKVRLLDLTRRNPLISTVFRDRNHSHLRLVDELPEIIYSQISNGQMTFNPLPDIDKELPDEQTDQFRTAILEAKATDEIYLNELDEINDSSDIEAQKILKIERDLIDRVRSSLGLPKRIWSTKSLIEHAKQHNINPSYELPTPEDIHTDGRHEDNLIQTLLLPETLDRRLEKMTSKCRLWTDETGVHVLYIAYGFLEWKESETANPQLSPLVLQPVSIEKRDTKDGVKFDIRSEDSECESNVSLALKLKNDFGIDIPTFDNENEGLESFFIKIDKLEPKKISHWKVKRQVVVGIFPSSKQIMYNDLDSNKWNFSEHPLLEKIITGDPSVKTDSLNEDNESKTPFDTEAPKVVLDADSSQFKVITSVIAGDNCAVEGPPGTGKSQTIVNTIAAAIAEGKKVLFVAEKNAALSVVKNRLDSIGIGDFCLPLLGGKQTRRDVYQRIKYRVELPSPKEPKNFNADFNRLVELKESIENRNMMLAEQSIFKGHTNYDILSKVIYYSSNLDGVSAKVFTVATNIPITKDPEEYQESLITIEEVEKGWKLLEKDQDIWNQITNLDLNRFNIEELQNHFAILLDKVKFALASINALGLEKELENKDISSIINYIEISQKYTINDIPHTNLIKQLKDKGESGVHDLKEYITTATNCPGWDKLNTLSDEAYSHSIILMNALRICRRLHIERLDNDVIEEKVNAIKLKSKHLGESCTSLENLCSLYPSIKSTSLDNVYKVFNSEDMVSSDYRNILSHILLNNIEYSKIETFLNTIKEMKQRTEIIDHYYNRDVIDMHDKYDEKAKIIQESGFFGFLSSKVRHTKKLYNQIDSRKLNKNSIANNFLDIHKWKNDYIALNKSELGKELLGDSFKGTSTSIDQVRKALNFAKEIQVDSLTEYVSISKLISNLSERELSFSKIRHLQDIIDLLSYKTLDDAINDLTETDKHLDVIEKDASTLLECKKVIFKKNTDIDIKFIKNAQESLHKIHQLLGSLTSLQIIDKEEKISLENVLYKGAVLLKSISYLEDTSNLSLDEIKVLNFFIKHKGNEEFDKKTSKLEENLKEAQSELSSISTLVGINCKAWDTPISNTTKLYSEHLSSIHRIHDIVTLRRHEDSLSKNGILNILLELSKCEIKEGYSDIYMALFFREIARRTFQDNNYLNRLINERVNEIENARSEFAKLDLKYLTDTTQVIRRSLFKNASPPIGVRGSRKKDWTEMHFINNEINKTMRFNSIRRLIKQSKSALMELMPCWMMSPMSVSQYLNSGEIDFDLVIIDEASQMTPENGIGALLRSKQAMIVGDTNQLPPTNFFHKALNVATDDEEDYNITEESILELANLSFHPQKRLRWHYRSRHSSLIQFSNKFVYDSELEIFPAPNEDTNISGVFLVEVKGEYKSGTNLIEAKEMVNAIRSEIYKHPDKSLGIVTMNSKQQELVQDEFNFMIKDDPKCKKYLSYWEKENDGLGHLFIKNLESVQGDERDTIIISTVYGPENVDGPVMQRFGPINGASGKRRLNVLFTRAKNKIITFSSMKPSDILAKKDQNPGAWMLKKWIEYSKTGKIDLAFETRKEPDSDFERHVIKLIESMGCIAVPQVGVSGYYIDIGVKHPAWDYGYLFGVECDGATYHSSKEARDRDRLREQVLKDMGWDLHRIWSTSWFDDPRREADRLRKVISEKLREVKKVN